MRWSDIDFQPTNRKLRQFAILLLLFASAIGLWHFARHGLGTAAMFAWLFVATIAILGIVRPTLVRWLFITATVMTFPLGWLLLHSMLVIVFFGLFTTWGLVARWLGRDALQRRKPVDNSTYWKSRPTTTNMRRYFRQY